MYLFDAEALRTFSSKQNHQKCGPLIKCHESEITDISIILAKIKKDKIHLLHNFGYFDYKYVVQESLENDPFSTYCLIWPNPIREINGKENYKLLILDTFRSVAAEKQKQKLY